GRVGHHRDRVEGEDPFRDGLEDGHPLRAEGEAVGGVLDVAPGHDLARARSQRRSHLELRVGGVGPLPRLASHARHLAQARRRLAAAHACFAASWMIRPRTSISPAAALSPTSRTSRWSSFCLRTPAAMLVMHEMARTRIPMCRTAITSGTVDMPTASAPSVRHMRISAGVSYDGPVKAMYTPWRTGTPAFQQAFS